MIADPENPPRPPATAPTGFSPEAGLPAAALRERTAAVTSQATTDREAQQ